MLSWWMYASVALLPIISHANHNTQSDNDSKYTIRSKRWTWDKNDVTGSINEARMRSKLIKCMNKYRRLHHAPPLTESAILNLVAHRWAVKLSETTTLMHQNSHELFGENLYSFSSQAGRMNEETGACEAWYEETQGYNFESNSMGQAGHFTQMVWADSTAVGVGVAAAHGRYVVVADYYPPGNYQHRFTANVFPRQRGFFTNIFLK